MRLLLALALAAPLVAGEDAREIIRRWVESDRHNQQVARNYTFVQRVARRSLNSDGSVKKTEIKTFDVTLSEGTPYQRLIEIDDRPLPPNLERKEQEKLRKSIEQRQKETAEQRAKRIAQWEKQERRNREFLRELLNAMDFTIEGEKEVQGRKAWMIRATPHPGFQAKTREAKFLSKMRGSVWIDEQDHVAVKIDAEAVDDISMGFFLAKVHKGTRFDLDMVHVNDEVWLPKLVNVQVSARILVAKVRESLDLTFRDYKKFQAESRIVASDEIK